MVAGSYPAEALLIPAQFRNGVQVMAPTLPANPQAGGARPFGKDSWTTEGTTRERWTTYLPEMKFHDRPTLRIEATLSADYGGGTRTYEIPMPDADGIWGGALLRNHVYRLEVRSVSRDAELEFGYTLCPWEERRSSEITFD